jgi:hypothetical protein
MAFRDFFTKSSSEAVVVEAVTLRTGDITFPPAHNARLVQAFGKQLNTTTPATYDEEGVELTPETPRPATEAEVRNAVIQYMRQVVYAQERATAVAAVSIPSISPNV